ncbi:MAG: radical SAM protein [Gammaproteobacteria bacterium]|nr:radical SAM protein [Gammaproteobacteria bacterium]MDH5652012.1 radical SAM protein [Gammaproteobacteria bacterium]
MLIKQYHVTVLSNLLLAYDKYSRIYDKAGISQSSYPGVFFLVDHAQLPIGINKAAGLLQKLGYPGNRLLVLETLIETDRLKENDLTGTGLGKYIESEQIRVNGLYYPVDNALKPVRVEEAMAEAYAVMQQSVAGFDELAPRTISVLPIANGCQAQCPFCFSKASISHIHKQKHLSMARTNEVLHQAALAGATRAVITGGGEPGLLPAERLHALIKLCRRRFDKVVMITNGYFIANHPNPKARLSALSDSGLSVLAVSRHHYAAQRAAAIMGLDVAFDNLLQAYRGNRQQGAGMTLRVICLLQKGGIDSPAEIEAYLDWAMQQEIEQVCFKELYVASSSESVFYDQASNDWSYAQQVPLAMLINYAAEQGWEEVMRLPWGSPVYRYVKNGRTMQVAAYTEPSVSWELANGMCRSWNLMADGRCYASLEVSDSEVLKNNTAGYCYGL